MAKRGVFWGSCANAVIKRQGDIIGVMKQHNATPRRQAYTLQEMAQIFGKHRSWAYRMVKEGRIKVITGFGSQLVPAHEIDRILGASPQSSSGDALTPKHSLTPNL